MVILTAAGVLSPGLLHEPHRALPELLRILPAVLRIGLRRAGCAHASAMTVFVDPLLGQNLDHHGECAVDPHRVDEFGARSASLLQRRLR